MLLIVENFDGIFDRSIVTVIVRREQVTFLLICMLTNGKIIIDNILYILNIIT